MIVKSNSNNNNKTNNKNNTLPEEPLVADKWGQH